MKHFCHHCGKEVENGNKFCPSCGALQDNYSDDDRYEEAEVVDSSKKDDKVASEAQTGLDLAIKILMVLSTVALGFALMMVLDVVLA